MIHAHLHATRAHIHNTQRPCTTQVTLSGGSEYLTSCAVVGGSTLELTLAQFWSSGGASQLEQVRGLRLCGDGSVQNSERCGRGRSWSRWAALACILPVV